MRENEELLFIGFRVSVGDGENVLLMDNGNGCTTILMYAMPLNYTLKKVVMVSFMLCFTTVQN